MGSLNRNHHLWLDKKIKNSLKENPNHEINLIEIHQYIEDIIDREYGGRPEQIFRSKDDWESKFKESYENFYSGLFNIFKLKTLRHKRNLSDSIFWILMALAIAGFLITIITEVFEVKYTVIFCNIIEFSFLIGFLISLLAIATLIYTIFIKKDLDKVYEESTKYDI